MKRIGLLFFAMLLGVCSTMAIPAHPGAARAQQPDGSYVTIRLHGDEWRNFNTTADGYTVVKDSRGYYVYATLKDGQLQATTQVAHDTAERSTQENAFLADVRKYQAPAMSEEAAAMKSTVEKTQRRNLARHRAAQYDYNNFKGLVILVQYKDKEFSRSDYLEVMTDMMNKEDYTGYKATNGSQVNCTGSVRDYFSDNSMGKFQPTFDLYGPYTIDFSQYDAKGTKNAGKLVNAAINAADADINFKDYDRDNDGYVDLIYFIFAGNGANYGGNNQDLFWPHRSVIWSNGSYVRKDGVTLWDYASSVELYGGSSTKILEGIGTICHEFSHVLGLPDFYDTDYEESGGESIDPGIWSLMAGGSYENYSRTPVGYSLYERWAVGFMDEIPEIDSDGSYTLDPLYTSNTGFRINSTVNNEYFLFENRQKSSFKWDRYLPGSGMLVHRVDKTNQYVWNNNTINANPEHNYYEVVRAGGKGRANTNYDVFPGSGRVTELHNATSPANLLTWGGKSTKWGLSNIKMNDGVVTFDVGNTFELKSLSVDATATVGLGIRRQLTAVVVPDYAEYTLTWSSDDDEIATVDQEGNVKGVSVGTCTITVTSNNGLTASCEVSVEELEPVPLDEFMAMQVDEECLLQLTDAEVLYVYQNTAYVRDAKGCIMLSNTGIDLKRNDVINGTLIAKLGKENNMFQVVAVEGSTNDSGLTITAGPEVEPRDVKLEELTEADYSDYVKVKAVQLEKSSGVWAYSGDKRARLWQKFQISGIQVPSSLKDKYYDIEVIYGTDVLNGQLIEELYLLSSPVEVDDPNATAISTLDAVRSDASKYNLSGQRVDSHYKGIMIVNGRKVVQ